MGKKFIFVILMISFQFASARTWMEIDLLNCTGSISSTQDKIDFSNGHNYIIRRYITTESGQPLFRYVRSYKWSNGLTYEDYLDVNGVIEDWDKNPEQLLFSQYESLHQVEKNAYKLTMSVNNKPAEGILNCTPYASNGKAAAAFVANEQLLIQSTLPAVKEKLKVIQGFLIGFSKTLTDEHNTIAR